MAKMPKWRRHTLEFKRQAVERMRTCGNIEALARELKVQRKLLYTWKWQLEGRPERRHADLTVTAEERKEKHLQAEITKLKLALAEKTLENDFFRSALLKLEEARPASSEGGASASTRRSARGRRSKANLSD
jgi:transposase-like protein